MKNLGTLFGCNLLIETDDPKIATMAEKYFQNLNARSKQLGDIELEQELASFASPQRYPQLFQNPSRQVGHSR